MIGIKSLKLCVLQVNWSKKCPEPRYTPGRMRSNPWKPQQEWCPRYSPGLAGNHPLLCRAVENRRWLTISSYLALCAGLGNKTKKTCTAFRRWSPAQPSLCRFFIGVEFFVLFPRSRCGRGGGWSGWVANTFSAEHSKPNLSSSREKRNIMPWKLV